MIGCGTTQGRHGSVDLTLRFRPGGAATGAAGLHALHTLRLAGLQPEDLLDLQVWIDRQPALTLTAHEDPCGRAITAGDMLAAMFGLAPGHQLRVPAAEFLCTVLASRTEVQLRLPARLQAHTGGIAVEADLAREPADAAPADSRP